MTDSNSEENVEALELDAAGTCAATATPAPEACAEVGAVATPPGDAPATAEDSTQALWAKLREELRGEIQSERFETWFRRAALVEADEERIVLAVQNAFTREWLHNYYRDVLERVVERQLGAPRQIEIRVDPELTVTRRRRAGDEPAAPPPAGGDAVPGAVPVAHVANGGARTENPANANDGKSALLPASDIQLNPRYRFESFVVGPCNRFAHAAAVGVSERPGTDYNPLFLHGNVGLGKTHLLQSLCQTILDRRPQERILYLSCESFVNHFIGALENGSIERFRNKYRGVDVLVVDDIHLLANKERTQEEFFHTFNTLYNAGKQIVLSSDSQPKDIPTLQSRLVSRFKWGLVTEVEQPCYETRMAILKRKSKARGRELPDDVAQLLAERIDSNIRELEGAVTKVLGYASLSGQPITPELARQCLREVFVDRRGIPTTEDIIRVVVDHFGVKQSDLQSRKRPKSIAWPRQIGMYLARKITRLSLEEIGGFFGGRDHSTVLYGVTKVDNLCKTDPSILDLVSELEAQLRRPEA